MKSIWKLDNITLVSNNSNIWASRHNEFFFINFHQFWNIPFYMIYVLENNYRYFPYTVSYPCYFNTSSFPRYGQLFEIQIEATPLTAFRSRYNGSASPSFLVTLLKGGGWLMRTLFVRLLRLRRSPRPHLVLLLWNHCMESFHIVHV